MRVSPTYQFTDIKNVADLRELLQHLDDVGVGIEDESEVILIESRQPPTGEFGAPGGQEIKVIGK
jgi:hypothetical protein